MRLNDIDTPALVVDEAILNKNIRKMACRAKDLGTTLRPHGKTPKCAQIAHKLLADCASGLTVSTMKEVEFYFENDIYDIFYAVTLPPTKAMQARQYIDMGVNLKCLIDSVEGVKALSSALGNSTAKLPLVIEIDVDRYRTGVQTEHPDFMEIAKIIDSTPALDLAGVMSYAGQSYECETSDAIASLAEAHRKALVDAHHKLIEENLSCDIVSFGSTPATLHAATMEGVTELRCGIYAFQDLFQAAIGSCNKEEIALSVLATVIGKRPDLNRLVIDAGGLALSKDLSTKGTSQYAGYGLVCEATTGKLIPDLFVNDTSQELGLLTTFSGSPINFSNFPIGSQVRVLPNHADMTAAAHEGYHVINGDDAIKDFWKRNNYW